MSDVQNITFDFENRVFTVEGAVFRKTSGGDAVALHVPMGETIAAVTIKQLKSGFDIAPDSRDDELLRYVTEALEYVREVYPGDSIPSEVISGQASWLVDERYLAAAQARVTMQLVAWITGEDFSTANLRDILIRAEDPETKKVVQEAFNDIAEKLGIGKDNREDVVQMVDRFAHELSYIEALRSELGRIPQLLVKLKKLHKSLRGDSALSESLLRCNTLLDKPVKEISRKFSHFDLSVGEILNTLRQYDEKVEYVRKTRDEFRKVYLLWDELLRMWEQCDLSEEAERDNAIRETYRFAAQHFVQSDDWSLSA
ncbi:MAG: hypothetical protein R3229_11155 [Alphaproteobacteria bacterium]|nr:hypothetical protein [Alphaproteobacteria bacterium]